MRNQETDRGEWPINHWWTFSLISGGGKELNQMFVVQYLGCSRSWTSCSSDPKGIENERRICVHYLWSGVTILNLLFPIPPLFFAFGYYRLATLGPTLDLFENNQGGVHSIKSFMPAQTNLLFLERKECGEQLFPFHWFLKAINPRFSHIFSPSRIGSASDDELMRKFSLLLAPDR